VGLRGRRRASRQDLVQGRGHLAALHLLGCCQSSSMRPWYARVRSPSKT
jgi:hypothetical protein